jgi:hypothetical protein
MNLLPERVSHADFLAECGPLQDTRTLIAPGEPPMMVYDFRGGHGIRGGKEEILTVGAKADDECFTHPDLGMMNITKMLKMLEPELAAHAGERFLISEQMIEFLSRCDIDMSVVDNMTIDRRDVPVLFMTPNRKDLYLIDGHHRLARRIKDGLDFAMGNVVPTEILVHTLVVMYARRGDEWVRADMLPEIAVRLPGGSA